MPSRFSLFVVTLLAVCLCLPVWAATDVTALASGSNWLWIALPISIVVLLVVAYVASLLATASRTRAANAAASEKERDFNMRIARVMDTVGSIANGIAATLLQHPPAPADVIAAVRGAAVAQGLLYIQEKHPQDLAVTNLAEDTLAIRLNNTVAGKLLTGSMPLPNAIPPEPLAAAA